MPSRYVYYGVGIPLGVLSGAEHMLSLGEGLEGLERREREERRVEGRHRGCWRMERGCARSARRKISLEVKKKAAFAAGCPPAAPSLVSLRCLGPACV